MEKCAKCSAGMEKPVASISGQIMGDEHTDVYYLCTACDLYTVKAWRDDFTGVETCSARDGITRAEGDAQVALIGRCSRPWDKKCRCEAHVEYFRGTLD